jgi:hypothetical protein
MIEPDLRDRIMAEPETILEDRDLMNALVAANERAMGANIVDLRGIAMQRLETRLDRLEDTHRTSSPPPTRTWPAPTRCIAPSCRCWTRWISRISCAP